jgi:hypothetical protein
VPRRLSCQGAGPGSCSPVTDNPESRGPGLAPAAGHAEAPARAAADLAVMANTLYRWLYETDLPGDLGEQVDVLMIATTIHLMAHATA